MKKKILCLLLVALMILTVVPAMSLSAFAGTADPEPATLTAEEKFEKYKHLYFGTGAGGELQSFVDMTGILDSEIADHSASALEESDLEGKRVLKGITYNPVQGTPARQWYVKIIGGQDAGEWYMLGAVNRAGRDSTVSATSTTAYAGKKYSVKFNTSDRITVEDGFIQFHTTPQDTDGTGIWAGRTYTATEVITNNKYDNATAYDASDYRKFTVDNDGKAFTYETVYYYGEKNLLQNFIDENGISSFQDVTDSGNPVDVDKSDYYDILSAIGSSYVGGQTVMSLLGPRIKTNLTGIQDTSSLLIAENNQNFVNTQTPADFTDFTGYFAKPDGSKWDRSRSLIQPSIGNLPVGLGVGLHIANIYTNVVTENPYTVLDGTTPVNKSETRANILVETRAISRTGGISTSNSGYKNFSAYGWDDVYLYQEMDASGNLTGRSFTAPASNAMRRYNDAEVLKSTVSDLNSAQIYLFRTYNVALTNEQMMRNHFADLCYYYNIDTTNIDDWGEDVYALTSNDDYAEAMQSLYNSVSTYQVGKLGPTEIAALQELVSKANPPREQVGNFKYYSSREMWYGSGSEFTSASTSLVSFVDLTHLTEAQTTLNDANLKKNLEANSDIRFISTPKGILTLGQYDWTGVPKDLNAWSQYNTQSGFSNNQMSVNHTYIKIVDGQLTGKYYNMSIPREYSNQLEVDDPILSTLPVAGDQIINEKLIAPDVYGNIKSKISNKASMYTSGNYVDGAMLVSRSFAESELTANWRLSQTTATINNEAITNNDWLADGYNNSTTTANAVYSVESVVRVEPFAQYSDNLTIINIGSSKDKVQLNKDVHNITAATSATAVATVAYSDAANAVITKSLMLGGAIDTVVGESAAFSDVDALYVLPRSTYSSQQLFVRIYDEALTEAQMKQNHLADLMYYYDIDLKATTADDYEPMYDMAMSLSVGLHSDGAEAEAYAATVAKLNAIVACAGDSHVAAEDDHDCTTPTLCTICNQAVAAAPNTSHDHSVPDYDDEGHWMKCSHTGCNSTANYDEHSFGAADCTKNSECTDCDFSEPASRTQHEFTVLQKDASGHWYKCAHCAQTNSTSATAATGDGQKTQHNPAQDDNDCTTATVCTVCEWEVTAAPHASHSFTSQQKDADGHWNKCANCNAVESQTKTPHNPEADDNDCTTPTLCEDCGWEMTAAPHASHSFTSQQKDADGHWNKCANCNAVESQTKTPHEPDATDSDCTKASICGDCGWEISAAQNTNHTFVILKKDTEGHWYKCAYCAQTAEKEPHAHGDDADCTEGIKCAVCDITMAAAGAHTPKADDGDCTTAVECSVCGKEAVAAKQHDFKGEYTYDEDGHAQKCVNCDAVGEKVAHTYVDGVCACTDLEPNKGLGGGAIAGIVCGSVAGAGAIGAAIWWFIFRKKKI